MTPQGYQRLGLAALVASSVVAIGLLAAMATIAAHFVFKYW